MANAYTSKPRGKAKGHADLARGLRQLTEFLEWTGEKYRTDGSVVAQAHVYVACAQHVPSVHVVMQMEVVIVTSSSVARRSVSALDLPFKGQKVIVLSS